MCHHTAVFIVLKNNKIRTLSKNQKLHQKEVNSLFIEIENKSTLTKHNIIVGCTYIPPSYQLHYFNELLGEILCKLESEICIQYFNCNTLVSNTSTEEFKTY